MASEMFSKWSNRLLEMITDCNMLQHPVWKLSTPFCAMQDDTGERYLPRNEAPEDEKLWKEQENNAEFYHTEFHSTATSLRSYKLPAPGGLLKSKYGEELFVGYGSSYEFN